MTPQILNQANIPSFLNFNDQKNDILACLEIIKTHRPFAKIQNAMLIDSLDFQLSGNCNFKKIAAYQQQHGIGRRMVSYYRSRLVELGIAIVRKVKIMFRKSMYAFIVDAARLLDWLKTNLGLHGDCTPIAPPLHGDCMVIAPPLHPVVYKDSKVFKVSKDLKVFKFGDKKEQLLHKKGNEMIIDLPEPMLKDKRINRDALAVYPYLFRASDKQSQPFRLNQSAIDRVQTEVGDLGYKVQHAISNLLRCGYLVQGSAFNDYVIVPESELIKSNNKQKQLGKTSVEYLIDDAIAKEPKVQSYLKRWSDYIVEQNPRIKITKTQIDSWTKMFIDLIENGEDIEQRMTEAMGSCWRYIKVLPKAKEKDDSSWVDKKIAELNARIAKHNEKKKKQKEEEDRLGITEQKRLEAEAAKREAELLREKDRKELEKDREKYYEKRREEDELKERMERNYQIASKTMGTKQSPHEGKFDLNDCLNDLASGAYDENRNSIPWRPDRKNKPFSL